MDLPYGIAPPAYRLPDAAHVGVVRLLVTDITQSLAYYERVVGLHRLSVDGARATLGAQDGRALLELHTRPGVSAARRGAFGLYHFAILLPDRAALGRFAAHIASIGVRVGMADHLVSEAFYLWDPDGLGIEVYADRPRGEWMVNGRELAMTTDPLDVASVIDEGGSVPWDGAPPGTTIGHVHLHVGALPEAEAFYHRALGLEKTVWNYPGALFMAAGGYHHHLGTNVWSHGPGPGPDDARLLEWELVVPSRADVGDVGESLRDAGYVTEDDANAITTADPWGTPLRVIAMPPADRLR